MLQVLSIFTLCCCLQLSKSLAFSGNGSGTELDPYQISNIHELQEINDDLSANYILMNDIDASETREWNNKEGWEPIGSYVHRFSGISFTGSLDGQNYSINNLYIKRPSRMYVGLFECICNGAVIKNLSIKDAEIIAVQDAGILAGRIYVFDILSEITIENCSVSGKVSFPYLEGRFFGGFCGSINAEYGTSRIYHCFSEADVISDHAAGGFCGINESISGTSIIEECYCIGTVNCNEYWGDYMGGFCGINKSWRGESYILNCFSTGNVAQKELSRGACFGGFCGLNQTRSIDNPGHSIIENCYSLGRVNGYVDLGGFCGQNRGEGLNQITNSYFNLQTSYLDSTKGGIGKTTSEMMMQFTYDGWDFENVWCIVEGQTYPQLQYFTDCDTLTSVSRIAQDSDICIFPNPADEYIEILIQPTEGCEPSGYKVKIFSQLSQIVLSDYRINASQTYRINIEDIPSGLYFCKFSGYGINQIRSFVVYR